MRKRNRTRWSSDEVTREQIIEHVWLFINCRIPGPTWDSQSKEKLTGPMPAEGGELWHLPDGYVWQGEPFPLPCFHVSCTRMWCTAVGPRLSLLTLPS